MRAGLGEFVQRAQLKRLAKASLEGNFAPSASEFVFLPHTFPLWRSKLIDSEVQSLRLVCRLYDIRIYLRRD
jgi:hypothetical protein